MLYCVRCKRKTETQNAAQIMCKNNRPMLRGICSECGSKKCTFLKHVQGEGLFNTALQYLPELHLPASQGEYVPNGSFNNFKKYSYCRPGTRYTQRIKEGHQGINELDKMRKLHDKFYNENQNTESRNISDIALAHRDDEISRDPSFDVAQRRDAKLVSSLMNAKAKFGLGTEGSTMSTLLNLKRGPMKVQ